MQESTTVNSIIKKLKKLYPTPECTLDFRTPFQLLIAVMLSAQCTDKAVNKVTPALLSKYPSEVEMSKAAVEDVQAIIRPLGFYQTKAKNIISTSKKLLSWDKNIHFDSAEEGIQKYTTLDGVGRKTANLVVGEVYKFPAVVTDTHVLRITKRLGLTENDNPQKVENDLKNIIPEEEQLDFCHRIVAFGRDICIARKPKCEQCLLKEECQFYRTEA